VSEPIQCPTCHALHVPNKPARHRGGDHCPKCVQRCFTRTQTVTLGSKLVGPGQPCYAIAELGINHGGSLVTAEKLIDAAAYAGAQAVKLQKRSADYYSAEELARPLESPYGTTRGDYVRAREFGEQAYRDLNRYARAKGLHFTASCWDLQALDDIMTWTNPPWLKIASAALTWPSSVRDPLLRAHAATGLPLVVSTGMCDLTQIDEAVSMLDTTRLVLLACTSTYPCEDDETNLNTIETLRARYGVPIGWSGHERGLTPTVWAVARHHACIVERHITLDRAAFGTDQAASLEPGGFARLIRDIRIGERADGSAEKRCLPSEEPIRAKLRRV
jgi:N-acetylneuraminate synthase